jgi:hypothetical protein
MEPAVTDFGERRSFLPRNKLKQIMDESAEEERQPILSAGYPHYPINRLAAKGFGQPRFVDPAIVG